MIFFSTAGLSRLLHSRRAMRFDHVLGSRVRSGGRADQLRNKSDRDIPTGRTLHGSHSQGCKARRLAVIQATKLDLIINLRTAKALGLQIPDKLFALADEVIE